MKIRVLLERPRQQPLTVAIVADGTATANDVATAIASAGLEALVDVGDRPLTLQVVGDYTTRRTLTPDTPLAESGVSSGTTLTVVQDGDGDARAPIGAVLRVVGGLDRGVEVPLRAGTSYLGRTADCQVRLQDPRVSKRHARLIVGRQIEVVDENSANGVVIAGQKVTRAVIKPGDTVMLGETFVQVEPSGKPEAMADTQVEVRYLRPPVVQTRPREEEIELPDVPQPSRKAAFPWLAMIAPLVMGSVMFSVSRSPLTLIFLAMSPVLMLASWIGNSVDAKRKHKAELANFDEAMAAVKADIGEARAIETQQLLRRYPSV